MLYAASLKTEDLGEQLNEYTPQIEAFIKQYIEGSCADLKVFRINKKLCFISKRKI